MPFCTNCGEENAAGTRFCSNCGANLVGASSSPPPPPPPGAQYGGYGQQSTGGYAQAVPDYLVQSILVTIFCCMPLGVPAIVFAAQANSKKAAGDYPGALEAAGKAKMFCWIAVGLGIAVIVMWFLLVMAGSASNSDF